MTPDQLQYFLDDFWNFQNVHQIWTHAPRIYRFYYTRILQKILESIWEHPLKISSLRIWTSKKCQFWKRRAPTNDEDPFNKIPKIMDMRPISA